LKGLSVSRDQLANEIVFPAQVVHAKLRYGATLEKESPYVLRLRTNSGGGRSCVLDGKEYSINNCHGDFYTFIGGNTEALKFQSFFRISNDIGMECRHFWGDGETALIVNPRDITVARDGYHKKRDLVEWAIRHGGEPNYEATR
jgi:hypothetical protein